MSRERQDVQPDFTIQPLRERILSLSSLIKPSARLKEEAHIEVSQLLGSHQDLQAHHKYEHFLMILEQSSVNIPVHSVSQFVDNIFHLLLRRRSLLCIVDGNIEEVKELLQRSVVHPVHQGYFYHAEVKDTASSGDRSVGLTLFFDIGLLLLGFRDFGFHFSCLCLCLIQHFDQFYVFDQISLCVRQTLEQCCVKTYLHFLVIGDVFIELTETLLK